MKKDSQNEQEAAELIKLATKESLANRRELLIAALGWELARYAFHINLLPSAVMEVVSEKQRSLSLHHCLWDEIFRHSDFPNARWGSLSKADKTELIRLLVGDQSTGARLLKAGEAKRHAALAKSSSNPAVWPMADGGYILMLRVYPGCGHNKTAKDFIKELGTLEAVHKYGRANSNDVARTVEQLRGIAALWLKNANIPESARNRIIFPTRAKKGDYTALRKATKAGQRVLAVMLGSLKQKSSESEELASIGQPLRDDLEAFIQKGKNKRR